jgi:hypothetical protein
MFTCNSCPARAKSTIGARAAIAGLLFIAAVCSVNSRGGIAVHQRMGFMQGNGGRHLWRHGCICRRQERRIHPHRRLPGVPAFGAGDRSRHFHRQRNDRAIHRCRKVLLSTTCSIRPSSSRTHSTSTWSIGMSNGREACRSIPTSAATDLNGKWGWPRPGRRSRLPRSTTSC